MSKSLIDRFLNHVVDSCDSLRETFAMLALVLIIATASYSVFEGWTWFESFYTAVVTSSSTGYGDFSPKTVGGRVTTILLIFSTIFFIIPLIITHLLSMVVRNRNEFTHEEQEELKTKLDTLMAELKTFRENARETEGFGA